jgi:hypothetical protein
MNESVNSYCREDSLRFSLSRLNAYRNAATLYH